MVETKLASNPVTVDLYNSEVSEIPSSYKTELHDPNSCKTIVIGSSETSVSIDCKTGE